MKRFIKIGLLVLMVLLLFFFVRGINLNQIYHSLHQIGWGSFMLLLLVTGIAYWMATLGWKVCLSHTKITISTARLFIIRHIGEVVTLINPTSIAGGEAAKMILLNQQYHLSKQVTASSILISRLILVYTQLICFFGITGLVVVEGIRFPVLMQQMLWGLVVVLIIAGIILGWLIKINTTKHNPAVIEEQQPKWKSYIIKLQQVWHSSMQFFTTNPAAIGYSSIYAILHWLFGGLEFYIILRFLQYDVSIAAALFVDLGVVFFKTAGAFIPGQIGVEEIGNKMMLESIGIDNDEVWITASLLRRGRQICWILFGILFYLILRKKIQYTKILPDGSIIRES